MGAWVREPLALHTIPGKEPLDLNTGEKLSLFDPVFLFKNLLFCFLLVIFSQI